MLRRADFDWRTRSEALHFQVTLGTHGGRKYCCLGCAGRQLVRINLSEQTDMMDLLGADLPVEGAAPGHFAWCAPYFIGA
jgi:hypothetical protein